MPLRALISAKAWSMCVLTTPSPTNRADLRGVVADVDVLVNNLGI
ncbi:hypothetical protein ACQEU6_02895 [Spirillospora sp. CA-108201]